MKKITFSSMIPAIIFAATLSISIGAMALLSETPGDSVLLLIFGAFKSALAFGDFLEYTVRLIITGLAATLVFRAGLFNLGGEGQALAGGLSAGGVAIFLPNLPPVVAIVMVLSTGFFLGGFLGGISGVLKAKWDVDELISSFLLSTAIFPVGNFMLSGPMRDPSSYLIAAPSLPQNYSLPLWMPPSSFGPAVILAIVLTLGTVIFLRYTRMGYEWRLRGANPIFAHYAGISTGRIVVMAMAFSGALYGMAGAIALLDGGQAVQGFTAGLGWNGLAVALIAGVRPELVPLAAVMYSWLETGTQSAMIHSGFSFSLIGFVQATVFLAITVRTRGGALRNKEEMFS